MRKKLLLAGLLVMGGLPHVAVAGGGAAGGGATEWTQIANNVQLGNAYAKQTQQYITQGLQYKAQLQNLLDNPFSLLGKDIGGIMNGVGELMSRGNSIGRSMAQIDKNFALKFKNPLAGDLAKKFTTWHQTNTDTLEAALKSAGLHRDQFATDAAAINGLYESASQTKGALGALKAVAEINAQQMIQLQSLQDLIATQNLAASTYMAEQNAKSKAREEKAGSVMGDGIINLPPKGSNLGGL